MSERLEPARAKPDNEMMDDVADFAVRNQKAPHLADILAQAVINDSASYEKRYSAALAAHMTRHGSMANVFMNAQYQEALALCFAERDKAIYEGMGITPNDAHDAAAQVVDYMLRHVQESQE